MRYGKVGKAIFFCVVGLTLVVGVAVVLIGGEFLSLLPVALMLNAGAIVVWVTFDFMERLVAILERLTVGKEKVD